MKTTIREGEDLEIQCNGAVPVHAGSMRLFSKQPGSSVYTEVISTAKNETATVVKACRHTVSQTYLISSTILMNSTMFKCTVSNMDVAVSEDSSIEHITIEPSGKSRSPLRFIILAF